MTGEQADSSRERLDEVDGPAQPRPFAVPLGLAAIFAWFVYITWFVAPFFAATSLICAVREFRNARHTGHRRNGAAWGLGVACLAVIISALACYGLATQSN
ncbi:hypothetical protein FGW37_25225 [Streptomyces rectiverticillatus]|uniref:hypothetical protein n=1 Tax=Streptomyces rectiverticillatus TaxID=173860 RepID=UPI0015C3B57D|nr:hypothetical protein [Streptomyces rectiverticillatus]QLE74458.1 hypothetical protein FGW37_25225 [Streptomyces rectiverticillatus]